MRSANLFLIFTIFFVATGSSLNYALAGVAAYEVSYRIWLKKYQKLDPGLSIWTIGVFLCIMSFMLENGLTLLIGGAMVLDPSRKLNLEDV